ncbi:beta-lactamase/transpeptidase-like protein [Chaetomium sp. MPI-SDFR-AT-0129]|nr:beta-lactamase/transpeptidase-like protein [Chaetomium sp. MPI-SDFR-AT-0129]
MALTGICPPTFAPLHTLLTTALTTGAELGLSFTVNHHGTAIIDLHGGHTDTARTQPWEANTIVNVFSTTKGLAALAVLILIDRGLVSPDDPVAEHWPEFAANGKEAVKIRHVLAHTSGVAGFDDKTGLEDLFDERACADKLARQAPWWTPGTASGYHSWSYGYLLGDIVRRVTGLGLRKFVLKEITTPLAGNNGGAVVDFQIGAPVEKDWDRVAMLVPPPPFSVGGGGDLANTKSIPVRSLMNPMISPTDALTPAWRRAVIGSGNGHANARSIAQVFSQVTLAGRKDQGGILLSQKTAELVFEEQALGPDLSVGQNWRLGLGYLIRGQGGTVLDDWLPEGRIAVWGGWGGSIVVMDLDRGLTIAYAMNKMASTGPATPLLRKYVRAVYAALRVEF